MADLTVRRPGGGLAQNDPFQLMRDSMRRMQDLFRDPMFDLDPIGYLESGRMAQFVPDFEVRETRDGLVFQADLPGVKEDDVDVTVLGNRLRVSGKREFQQETRGDTWYAAERSYGNFTRTFVLPEGCDTNNVDANLENGVLTIRLGKSQASQPRRISLGGGKSIEGQYSQGPFHQSAAGAQGQPAGANVGQQGGANLGQQNKSGANLGQPNVGGPSDPNQGYGQQQGGIGKGAGQEGYGGMYGRTPEAGRGEYGAAAGGFEHGEQAGGGKATEGSPDKVRAERDDPDKL